MLALVRKGVVVAFVAVLSALPALAQDAQPTGDLSVADTWQRRIEGSLARVEKLIDALDLKKTVPSSDVLARITAAHKRLEALESAAQIAVGKIRGKPTLADMSADVASLSTRAEALKAAKSEKQAEPKPSSIPKKDPKREDDSEKPSEEDKSLLPPGWTRLTGIPPKAKYSGGHTVKQSYDRFYNTTTVEVETPLSSSARIVARWHWEGARPVSAPRTVAVSFIRTGREWQWLRFHFVILLFDGVRLQSEGRHYGDVITGGVYESVMVQIPTQSFLNMLQANRMEFKVGLDEFTLSGPNRNALKDFASTIPSAMR